MYWVIHELVHIGFYPFEYRDASVAIICNKIYMANDSDTTAFDFERETSEFIRGSPSIATILLIQIMCAADARESKPHSGNPTRGNVSMP